MKIKATYNSHYVNANGSIISTWNVKHNGKVDQYTFSTLCMSPEPYNGYHHYTFSESGALFYALEDAHAELVASLVNETISQ